MVPATLQGFSREEGPEARAAVRTHGGRPVYIGAGLVFACGLLLFGVIFGPGVIRLVALSPSPAAGSVATSVPGPSATSPLRLPASRTALPYANQPSGHIVFTCQIFKTQAYEQICIINPDGSGFRRLTSEDTIRHFYPSLAADGTSVVYSQYQQDNDYQIYQMRLSDGQAKRLTEGLGVLTAPAISPDGKFIVFTRWTVASNEYQIWLMDLGGGSLHRLTGGTGWDPSWSPDGSQVLFASDRGGSNQLWVVNLDGTGPRQVGSLPALRGRSAWSRLDQIVTYSGVPWHRELYIMDTRGQHLHQLSPSGGDSQGPSFSPDGEWVAFTAYFDHPGDINGCEIYILRVDGSDLRRVTNNDYCDYQPRWGP